MNKPYLYLPAKHRCLATVGAALVFSFCACNAVLAYPRYKNDAKDSGSNCSLCHGDFTGGVSPKGTVFPSGSKHEMHRAANSMDTDCNLCHTTGDNHNPFTWTSNGTANNTGLGCSGCHVGAGLRAHHAAVGITFCAACHPDDGPPPPEDVSPPYYGTLDTRADTPCNPVLAANTNENWSVGDFLGLDNNGNNLYDMADFACGPYRIVDLQLLSNDVEITWETAGGRTDILEASPSVTGTYSQVSPALPIPGVGVVSTNQVDADAATNSTRFYRIRFIP